MESRRRATARSMDSSGLNVPVPNTPVPDGTWRGEIGSGSELIRKLWSKTLYLSSNQSNSASLPIVEATLTPANNSAFNRCFSWSLHLNQVRSACHRTICAFGMLLDLLNLSHTSNCTHPPTSPNIVPAKWHAWLMPLTAQQAALSFSDLVRYCACHTKLHSPI